MCPDKCDKGERRSYLHEEVEDSEHGERNEDPCAWRCTQAQRDHAGEEDREDRSHRLHQLVIRRGYIVGETVHDATLQASNEGVSTLFRVKTSSLFFGKLRKPYLRHHIEERGGDVQNAVEKAMMQLRDGANTPNGQKDVAEEVECN